MDIKTQNEMTLFFWLAIYTTDRSSMISMYLRVKWGLAKKSNDIQKVSRKAYMRMCLV